MTDAKANFNAFTQRYIYPPAAYRSNGSMYSIGSYIAQSIFEAEAWSDTVRRGPQVETHFLTKPRQLMCEKGSRIQAEGQGEHDCLLNGDRVGVRMSIARF